MPLVALSSPVGIWLRSTVSDTGASQKRLLTQLKLRTDSRGWKSSPCAPIFILPSLSFTCHVYTWIHRHTWEIRESPHPWKAFTCKDTHTHTHRQMHVHNWRRGAVKSSQKQNALRGQDRSLIFNHIHRISYSGHPFIIDCCITIRRNTRYSFIFRNPSRVD